jgi:hypothetical protein
MKTILKTLTVLVALAGASAQAQDLRFSMKGGGASAGATGFDGSTLRGGAVLYPELSPPALGPLNPPGTLYGRAAIGLKLSAASRDIDAMSHGRDGIPNAGIGRGGLLFSVDGASRAMGGSSWASVRNERPEAEADSFTNIKAMPAVPADDTVVGRHAAVTDGNGLAHPLTGFLRGGLGLVETGDAVDGLDQVAGVPGGLGQLFFSLTPAAAAAHGYQPGDVLLSDLSGTITVFAGASVLGLDKMGAGTDDVDALAVWDDPSSMSLGYVPPASENDPETPYVWGPGQGDMILFSVTRSSAVVGQLDSHFGIPIQPGDVLTIPEPLSPISSNPAIVVAAERIFLRADRTGGNVDMDDLDALDLVVKPLFDCNGNGIEDAVDIASGAESDTNLNGIPDGCEGSYVSYCTAGISASGCQATLSASGAASASAASGFYVSASDVEGDKPGQFFFGTNGRQANPWGSSSSFMCVKPPVFRAGILSASGTPGACDGSFVQDLNARWTAMPAQNPGAGAVVQLQLWYRNPAGGSSVTTAFSDAIEFVVGP